MKCVICGKEIKGFGNNAYPVADGKCCNECNTKVVEARLLNTVYDSTDAKGKEVLKMFIHHDNQVRPVQVGDRLLILEMRDEPQYSGKVGVVKKIDDAQQIHGTWGGCALIPNYDVYVVLCQQSGAKLEEKEH